MDGLPRTVRRVPHAPQSVIAYHGCSREAAMSLLGGAPFLLSRNQWDWLGLGIYFWEYAPVRARDWAVGRYGRAAAVLQARVRPGRCVNLLDSAHFAGFRRLYDERLAQLRATDLPVPENRIDGRHLLDRFMVDEYCADILIETGRPVQTVRACFPEGEAIYPGSAILSKTHVQIAVRDPSCITNLQLVS